MYVCVCVCVCVDYTFHVAFILKKYNIHAHIKNLLEVNYRCAI